VESLDGTLGFVYCGATSVRSITARITTAVRLATDGETKMIKKAPLKLLLLQRRLSLAAMVSLFALGVAVSHAQGLSDVDLQPVTRDAMRELATKITQPFVFAAVGDVWATTRPNAPLDDPRVQSLFGIMRSADMTYANMEGPIIDYGAYSGPRVGSSKTFVGELKNMGIRIMTTANNHSMDAGPEGVFMTNRFLDEAGIAQAGTGKNLTAPSGHRHNVERNCGRCRDVFDRYHLVQPRIYEVFRRQERLAWCESATCRADFCGQR
jgi:hypothetical protein